jgi:hypothetical protein
MKEMAAAALPPFLLNTGSPKKAKTLWGAALENIHC